MYQEIAELVKEPPSLLVTNEAVAVKSGARLVCAVWCQRPGYDLRRTRRDLPDLTRNAAYGGIDQRFPMLSKIGLHYHIFSRGYQGSID